MDNKALAQNIVAALGGPSNIQTAENCMTRLRVQVFSEANVSIDKIKQLKGILGVIEKDGYLQIVLGPGAAKKVTDEVKALLQSASPAEKPSASPQVSANWQKEKAAVQSKQKKNGIKDFLALISNIFIPLIPAIIAAGLFNGFGSLIAQLITDGTLGGTFWTTTQLLFSLLGSSFLGYFVIFTGINAAKSFGATPALGGMIGALTIGANIIEISKQFGLYNADIPAQSILTTGKGGVIGVIFAVWVLSLVEKQLHKRVPDVLDLIVTPFLSLLITSLAVVFVIMPLTGILSDLLVAGFSLLLESNNIVINIVAGFILAAVFLPMVLLGLHHGLVPIYALQLEQMGGVSLFPVLAMSGAGQVGAAIAIYLLAKRAHNKTMQQIIAGALPAGLLGVGEPLIYGVTLPLGKPFITAGIGAGFGGAYIMLTHILANAWGPSGLVAIPLMQGFSGMINFFVGLCIAYVMGFVVTSLFMKASEVKDAV